MVKYKKTGRAGRDAPARRRAGRVMKQIGRETGIRIGGILLLVFLALAALVSCGKKTDEEVPEPAPEMLTGIFSASPLDLPAGYANENLESVPPAYDAETGRVLAYGARYTRGSDGWTVEKIEHAVFSLDPAGGEAETVCTFSLDGAAEGVQAGCFADGFFVFAAADNAIGGAWTLRRLDLGTGKTESAGTLNAFLPDGGFFRTQVASDGEGNLYAACGAEVALFGNDLVWRGNLPADGEVRRLAADTDGTVWMCVGQSLTALSASEKGPAAGRTVDLPENASSFWFAPGYDLYVGGVSQIRGMNFDTEGETLVYSGASSGFSSSEYWPCAVIDAETLLLFRRTPEQYNPVAAWAKKQPDLDVSDLEVLRVALLPGSASGLDDLLVGFRREHPEILVVTEDYTPYANESADGAADAFLFDWTNNGYRPDVLIAGNTDAAYLSLRGRGLLADLRPRIDGDDAAAWDDLFGAVKTAFTEDGAFVSLCGSFEISCTVGRAEDWEKTDVTAAELLAFAADLPEGTALSDMEWQGGASASAVWTPVLETCVDLEAGRADFSLPVFADMLAYLDTLPKQRNWFGLSEMNFWAERWTLPIDGRVRLGTAILFGTADPLDWWLGLSGMFGGGDFALLRTSLTNGMRIGQISAQTYSITKDARNPEAAWAFVKFLASPDNHRSVSGGPDRFAGVPAQKSVFDALAAARMGKTYLVRWRDRAVFEQGTLYGGLGNEPHGEVTLTEETAAAAREFFDTFLDGTRTTAVPTAIHGIVREEVSAYLGGARSAEECANVVQSRVGLWLAENAR